MSDFDAERTAEVILARYDQERRRNVQPTTATRPGADRVARALLGPQKGLASLARHKDCMVVVFCQTPKCNGAVVAVVIHIHTSFGDADLWISRNDVAHPSNAVHNAVWLDGVDDRVTDQFGTPPDAKCMTCHRVWSQGVGSAEELRSLAAATRVAGKKRRRVPARYHQWTLGPPDRLDDI